MSREPRLWPFFRYEKIQERLADWFTDDEAAYRAAKRAAWVGTEKIHGANFCFVSDGSEVRCAKRKAFLLPSSEKSCR